MPEFTRSRQDLDVALLFGVNVNRFEGAGPIVRVEPDQGSVAVLGGDLERHPLACSNVFDVIAGSWHLCTLTDQIGRAPGPPRSCGVPQQEAIHKEDGEGRGGALGIYRV
jgi:hypothetical protein